MEIVPITVHTVCDTSSLSVDFEMLGDGSDPAGDGMVVEKSSQILDQSFCSSEDTKSQKILNSLDVSFSGSTSSIPQKNKVLKANGCEINLTKYMLPGNNDSDEDNEIDLNGIPKTEVVLYTESLFEEFWDSAKEKWIHPRTGKYLHMQEAIDCGVLCPEIVQVKQSSGQTVNLQKAINSGQINIHTGKTINLKTALTWPFHVAVAKGLVKINDNEPIEKCDMYTELGPGLVSLTARKELLKETKILDRRLDQWLDVPKSVDTFIFDTEWGKVKDNMTGKWLSWMEAKELGLILDPRLGEESLPSTVDTVELEEIDNHIVNLKVKTNELGQKEYGGHILFNQNPQKLISGRRASADFAEKLSMSLAQRRSSIAADRLSNTSFPIMLDEAIKQGLYNSVTNKVHNPKDGSDIPFEDAIRKGLISRESLVRDPVSRDILSLQEAVDKRIIDPESGKMIDANEQAIALNFAFSTGLIMRSKSPLKLSLSEILDEGLFDEELGTFLNPDNNEEIKFSEAVNTGLIDKELIKVRNTETGKVMSLEIALEKGLVFFESGVSVDLANKERVQILESLERGILIDVANQPKMTLQSTIEEQIYDPETGTFKDIELNIDYSLGDAIESGFLDSDSVCVRDPSTLTVLTVDAAIVEGIIDPQTGLYTGSGIEIGFTEAIEKGLVLFNASHGVLPCSVLEAVRFNIYDPKSKKFVDPKSGNVLTLEMAIEENLIDPRKTLVKDTSTGRFLSLMNAEYLGVVDAKLSLITRLKENEKCDLKQAKEMGILRRSASEECLSLKTAVNKRYINEAGEIFDPLSKKYLTLADAMMVRAIDPTPTLVKNVKLDKFMPLTEAVEKGLIDAEMGLFINTATKTRIGLVEAFEMGYIIEIPLSGLTLAEAVQHGLYLDRVGCFLDVRTGKQITLQDSIEQKLIDPSRPQVVIPGVGLFSLKESFEFGYLDKHTGTYLHSDEPISLSEAVEKFLIVTVGGKKRNKSMSDSCCDDIDHGKTWNDLVVKDPNERLFISMEQAVEEGIIDIQTECFCDLKHNIIIPVSVAIDEGHVMDAKNPKLGLGAAFNHGIYDSVTNTLIDPRGNVEVTLAEALRSGLIDTHRTRVKNLETGKFISLKQALSKGIISDKTGSVFEKSQKKTFTLDFAVKEELIIDFSKQTFTIPEGVKYGMISHDGLMVEDLNTGELLSLDDALDRGIIDKHNTTVKVFESEEDAGVSTDVPLAEAISQKIVDDKCGVVKLKTGRRMSIAEAVSKQYIAERKETDILTEDDSVSSMDPSLIFEGNELSELQKSIEKEIHMRENQAKSRERLKPDNPLVDVGMTGSFTSDRSDSMSSPIRFDEALKFGFLDLETGEFMDYLTDIKSTIEVAASQGRLSISKVLFTDESRQITISLKDALQQKLLYQVNEGKSERSDDKKGLTFKEALSKGLLLVKSKSFSDISSSDGQLSVKSDTSQMVVTNRKFDWLTATKNVSSSLDSLIQNVKDDQSRFRIGTLFDSIEKGVFDSKEGVLKDNFIQKKLSIGEALKCGLINNNAEEIIDPSTDECITVEEAISRKIIDVDTGMYVDPLTGSKLMLSTAKDAGYIVKTQSQGQSKSSVEIYVEEILSNEDTKAKNGLQDAFSAGVLNRSKSQVIDPDTVQPITLRRAGSLGMIDTKTGEFKNPQTRDYCTLSEAVKRGFILSPKGLTLYSSVNQGLYNEESGQFKDPASETELSLRDMIKKDVITDECKEVRDVTKDGSIVKLKEAIRRQVIDADAGMYVSSDQQLNFKEAISAGLLISAIPREGLRESSNTVETLPGMKRDQIWKSNIRAKDSFRDGPTLCFKPGDQSRFNDGKITSSTSSMDTNSSGYETNQSQNKETHDDSQRFAVEIEKLKAKQSFLKGGNLAANDNAEASDVTVSMSEKENKEKNESSVMTNKDLQWDNVELENNATMKEDVLVNGSGKNVNDTSQIVVTNENEKTIKFKDRLNNLAVKDQSQIQVSDQSLSLPSPVQGVKSLVSPVRNKEFLFHPGLPQSISEERQV